LADNVTGPTDIAELLAVIVYALVTFCVFSIIGTAGVKAILLLLPTIAFCILVNGIFILYEMRFF
jgi:hypothetical protein